MTRRCWEEAARRHFRDAQYLLTAQPPSLENADHLLGVCADSVMNVIGDFVAAGQGQRFSLPEKIHINQRWSDLIASKGQGRINQYLVGVPSKNPFGDWHVNQRYACDGKITAGTVQQHQNAASKLLAVLDSLKTAGLL